MCEQHVGKTFALLWTKASGKLIYFKADKIISFILTMDYTTTKGVIYADEPTRMIIQLLLFPLKLCWTL